MATLLDETLGTPVFVQWAAGCATAELTVKFERPLPTPVVVLCGSWVEKMEGRKAWDRSLIRPKHAQNRMNIIGSYVLMYNLLQMRSTPTG